MYKGRLKVILLLQVSCHEFEPTFIIFRLNWRVLPDQPKQNKSPNLWRITSILVCCIFVKVLYYSLNGRSGNFLSLACACWWWQQKASWPKFDYKVVSILTETFFLGKHFGRIFTLKVSLNIHFRRKSIKLKGISNFVGRKNISSKKSL